MMSVLNINTALLSGPNPLCVIFAVQAFCLFNYVWAVVVLRSLYSNKNVNI